MKRRSGLCAIALGCAMALPAAAQEISGAGSTFVYPIISKWSEAYGRSTGIRIEYQPIGSSMGVEQIKAATVDFGASDAPLKPEQLADAGLIQFPVVTGGVVPVVNIDGVEAGQMRFSGKLLADLYLGKIKKWNDPEVEAINPGIKLPDQKVSVVHRSDGSGTTFNWADFLSKTSDEWRTKVGPGSLLSWPTGSGGKGNQGVADNVNRIKGSIGYVEYAYVIEHNLKYGLVQNRAGNFIKPDTTTFQAASASADWAKAPDFYLIITDAPGPEAYPITATSFVLIRRQPSDAARVRDALAFFKWALENGQPIATSLGYAPLPEALVARVEASWEAELR